MIRVDYFHDPDAPAANTLVPAVSAIVVDRSGRILLQRRGDNGMWAPPGGGMELGESVTQCAIRETLEETGIAVRVVGMVGVYSDPDHRAAYPDGEVCQEFSVCLLCEPTGGSLAISAESTDAGWFEPSALDALAMTHAIRRRIDDYLEGTMPAIR